MPSAARKLYGPPVLLQDWDTGGEATSAAYWELFLDLLLVAAASATADGLKESPTFAGVTEFIVMYFMFINGWLLYTHHVTTRFEDGTLLHTMNLFLYLLGFAYCVINVGYETAFQFSRGAIVQRVAVLAMMVNIYVHIPRARPFCGFFAYYIGITVVVLMIPAIYPQFAPICWWTTVVIESTMESTSSFFLHGTALVPVNIEHTKERFGCIVLVMLGETVVSATILYRQIRNEEEIIHEWRYNQVLALEFLLVFMLTLFYFHMQPPMEDHALRRSRIHGSLLITCTRLLGLALLLVGVAVKIIVVAVVHEEPLTPFASKLMGISVGMSLTTMFLMRVLHYGGRMPRPFDPPNVKRIMWCWWGYVGMASIIPFGTAGLGWTDPLHVVFFYASMVFCMTVVESTITHILAPHLIVHGGNEQGSLLRQQLGQESKLYDSISEGIEHE